MTEREYCPHDITKGTCIMCFDLLLERVRGLESEIEELMRLDYWQDRYNIVGKENAKLRHVIELIRKTTPVRKGDWD
jgi:hypothetical protein